MKTINEILEGSRRALPPCSATAAEKYTIITSLLEPDGHNKVMKTRLFHITFLKKGADESFAWELSGVAQKDLQSEPA